VRMALGASAGRVLRQVLGNTLRLTSVGIVIGGLAAIAVTRSIASLLFATSPWDLPSYLGMAVTLLLVAIASGYIPARRASAINPVEALRNH
jgi:ABC-type antimicrobial peptide transport system permease subunit